MEDDVEVDVEDDGGIGATTRKEYAQRQSREGDAGGGGGPSFAAAASRHAAGAGKLDWLVTLLRLHHFINLMGSGLSIVN